MKKLKRLTVALLLVVMAAFMMTGCSVEKTSSQLETEARAAINDQNAATVKKTTQSIADNILAQMTSDQFASMIEQGQTLSNPLFSNDFLYRWQQFSALHGNVASAVCDEVERTKTGDYTGRIIMTGEDGKTMAMTITFDETLSPVSTTIADYSDDSSQSLATKLETAAGNTATGLLTVFVILVFLIFVISSFNFLPKPSSGKKADTGSSAKPIAVPAAAAAAAPAPAPAEEDLMSNNELIAVIAAAIAASEDKPADGYVVRSIRRLHNNKWR